MTTAKHVSQGLSDGANDSAAQNDGQQPLVVFRPELHAWVCKAVLEVTKEAIGQDEVARVLAQFGVSEAELMDREAWISLEFTEALLDEFLSRADDPQLFDRAARLAVSPKYLGPLYAFLRAFGDVVSAYDRVAAAGARFNKTGSYSIEHLGLGRCTLRFAPSEDVRPERTTHMCRFRLVQLQTIPTLFDLAPAVVKQPKCLVRGDECCVYELEWTPAPRRQSAAAGAILGLAAGITVVLGAGLGPWAGGIVAAAFALGGWALGRTRELRQNLAQRIQDVTDQQDALARSLRSNEERFEELLEAKTEVEQKVDQRTVELREATQRLSDTLSEIQAIDKAKTDFFNNVSHELRSPLTLILAPLEDMTAGRTPPGGEAAAFASMHRNAARLLHLINQLLDLAKIDAGEMQIAPLPTDLVALVRSTLNGFEAAAKKKGVSLEAQAPGSMPPVVMDASWIESAVTNLVANALRLTNRGGGVRVTVEDRGGDVSVAVSDDGPGIALEDQKKVFERFAQGDSSKRVIGGTGIGLALVREAARLHGGEVKLVSELGKGATFTLVLPRRPETYDPAKAGERLVPSSQPPPRLAIAIDDVAEEKATSERPGPAPNAPFALVVEDNPELREFMVDVLAVRYRVRAASDGRSGLALARELKPDVVVSDVAMPEMNGYELCRALRSNEETRSIPVLLVTARTEVASVLEGFEVGANDYVLKPFHGRELLARVDVHVRLRRMMQEIAQHERHAMLGVLAASVAHQVRNPLTTLVSGLPAMRSRLAGKVTEPTQQLMDIMIDCAGRIERITVDLMDLSRVDRETGGDFQPSDGLRAAIRLVRARLSDAVTIEERIEDSPVLHGRAGDMNHVFLNLLDNAVRAVGERGQIRVEATTSAEHYVVRVGDSGKGIDDEVAKRIFEPFFTTRQAGEGTGLGLAIARQVLQQCGGQIEVGRSDLGGAVFAVYIPVASRPLSRPPAEQPTVH